ncbi:MAG TPA: DUF3857 and transglutaminase domain-containing protein [Longimicrobiales bacterium]
MSNRLALCALFLVAAPLSAQAPVVTADGDPTVDDDTIYALVVDAADYPRDAAVRLLDDGIVRVNADGSHTATYRTVMQILKPEAVSGWSEFTWQIDPARERFRLNWVRVLRPDGSVITDEPLHYQESDVPVGPGPVFDDSRQITFSLSGVEVGTIVDYSTTVETFDPVLPGDVLFSWGITTGTPVMRSRYILEAPVDAELRIMEQNVPAPARVVERGGTITRSWVYSDLETIEPEAFAGDSMAPWASLLVSGGVEWADIARWYAGLADGRYELGPQAARAVDSVSAGLQGDARLRELHRWIAQDIRYVSLALGDGGYQPRTPEETWTSRAGDCKDKATLFVAAARRLGYEANPVIVSSVGGVLEEHPSLRQFDHAIAAFRPGGARDWQYADLTADIVRHGQLPYGLLGSFGMLVHDDGEFEGVTLPDLPATAHRKVSALEGELLADGSFRGKYRETATGFYEQNMRARLSQSIDPSRHREVANAIARNMFPAASGDSLLVFEGLDWDAEAALGITMQTVNFVQDLGGGRYLLTIPLTAYGEGVKSIIGALDEDTLRTFFIDAEQLADVAIEEERFTLRLPDGWTADIPDDVDAPGIFGDYRATYELEDGVLRITRSITGKRGQYSPDRLPDLYAWLRAMSEDDARFILIQAP